MDLGFSILGHSLTIMLVISTCGDEELIAWNLLGLWRKFYHVS
jgi:hypothetical protein